jgi:S-disulfanyl-L-cysteine oxidoreductase SoxD
MHPSTRCLLASAVVCAAVAFSSAATAQGPAGSKTVWDGVYTDAQSSRGESVSKASCVSCHGDELAGSDLAPALQGNDFQGVWTGRAVAELFEKVHTTMPADRVGMLKPEQSADLVAYILKINGFPAGAGELASEMPALLQIKISSKR